MAEVYKDVIQSSLNGGLQKIVCGHQGWGPLGVDLWLYSVSFIHCFLFVFGFPYMVRVRLRLRSQTCATEPNFILFSLSPFLCWGRWNPRPGVCSTQALPTNFKRGLQAFLCALPAKDGPRDLSLGSAHMKSLVQWGGAIFCLRRHRGTHGDKCV